MARLVGVDLPQNKRIQIALTYIYGIGSTLAERILKKLNIDPNIRVKKLTEEAILALREELSSYLIEGDLRRKRQQDIKRLKTISCYRGARHRRGLPVRGQRTKTNARTRKGRAIPVAGKKKATK